MPPLPKPDDFPPKIKPLIIITPPPQGQKPFSILLLLHGLGDTGAPFAQLGRQLSLPYTCCISVQAPSPVPALFMGDDRQGWHWGKDIIVDQSSGDLDPEGGGLEPGYDVLDGIWEGLRKAGWRAREVLMLGFGQGGCVALGCMAGAARREEEFGGVVCIGGKLPGSLPSAPASGSATPLGSNVKKEINGKSPTPILLLGGSRSTAVTKSAVAEIKAKFGSVEYVKWDKTEDSMPQSREEMLPIMRFFARRLRSGAGIPEGAVEVR